MVDKMPDSSETKTTTEQDIPKKKWKITQVQVFLGVPSDWMLLDYDNPQYNG
jgi:hypothetical protein